jgi:hypothetical membrane protein
MSSFASVQPAVRPGAAVAIRDQRLAGAAFIVMAAQFMTAIMLAASIAPGYDFGGGAISDLGVIPATAGLFNASLAAVGVLNLAGGWWLYAGHRRVSVLAVFVAAGLGAFGAALVPLDRGDLHSLFALAAFVAFNVEPIAVGALERGWLRVTSILVGMVGLVFVGLMIAGDGGNPAAFGAIGHGGTERMIVYPVMLWLLVFGGRLTARDRAE